MRPHFQPIRNECHVVRPQPFGNQKCRIYFSPKNFVQVESASGEEREKLEQQNREKLEELKERLEAELSEEQEQIEKKHAYRMQQARQELEDKHEKVRFSFSISDGEMCGQRS